MRTTYDEHVDSLYIHLAVPAGTAIAATREVEQGIKLDLDDEGRIIGIEVLEARWRISGSWMAISAAVKEWVR
jgi:uncharacterized protein YuzE